MTLLKVDFTKQLQIISARLFIDRLLPSLCVLATLVSAAD